MAADVLCVPNAVVFCVRHLTYYILQHKEHTISAICLCVARLLPTQSKHFR
jgi:hypothetical protein